jgi:predicted TIM-barrel fold metal-dependent hydrolase
MTMKSVIAAFVFISLMGFATASVAGDKHPHIGDGIKDLPLFDAHIHYKEAAWGPFPPATVLELMDASGVAMALVSSTPDAGTIKLWEFAPKRIVPELRPYHGGAGSSNWTTAEGMFDYLMKRLKKYPHQGIGEFHLHQVGAADEPLLRKIAAVAQKKNIVIHVHSCHKPVDFLFSVEPTLKIIWAHAGMSEPAETVERMMAKYKTLYADTSYRENDILAGDNIDPAWRQVIERFPERFMVGTDTWVNDQWADYAGLVALNRQWLSQFSKEIATKIAYQNAERLFGKKIGMDLIGKR